MFLSAATLVGAYLWALLLAAPFDAQYACEEAGLSFQATQDESATYGFFPPSYMCDPTHDLVPRNLITDIHLALWATLGLLVIAALSLRRATRLRKQHRASLSGTGELTTAPPS